MARFRAGALRVGVDAPCRWDGAKHNQLHDHECAYFALLAAAPPLSLGKLAQSTQNLFHLLKSNNVFRNPYPEFLIAVRVYERQPTHARAGGRGMAATFRASGQRILGPSHG